MAFYLIPRLNEAVRWLPEQPRTVLRYAANGGLVLLHATADAALTAKAWQTQALQLGLFGTSLEEEAGAAEVPPVLCARLGGQWELAAPACIFEINDPEALYAWLNARTLPAELRLLLLRLDAARPGQATVEASRRVWDSEWATGDALLRLRLEQQFLRTDDDDAGQVQHAGRQLVALTPAAVLLSRAEFRLDVAGEGPLPTAATAALMTN